jgi:hypothetical protein
MRQGNARVIEDAVLEYCIVHNEYEYTMTDTMIQPTKLGRGCRYHPILVHARVLLPYASCETVLWVCSGGGRAGKCIKVAGLL